MQSGRTKAGRHLNDLSAFVAVAQARSFSRAASELGLSNSMLSYTIKRLEKDLDIVLLRRTSRSVSLTEAGEKLLLTLEPALEAIDDTLSKLEQARERVAGTLRITATREAYRIVIRPIMKAFCKAYPEVTLEVNIDYAFRDIVAERFDAGIRLGEKLEQDMVALPVSADMQMVVVASPAYLKRHAAPRVPEDLRKHHCINFRMPSTHSIYAWEFEKGGRALKMGLSGPLIFNDPDLMLQAALDGLGVAYCWEHEAANYLAQGRLTRLLADWTPSFPGFFLYYPSRRQVSPALAAFLASLRAKRDSAPRQRR
jgi:DNA-binding transcriptional LysR family regulator